MNFDVSVNGRPWKVAIEPLEPTGRFTATVKGRGREFDVAWIDAGTLSLIEVEPAIAREIRFERRGSEIEFALDGKIFRTTAEKRNETEKRGQTPFLVRDDRTQQETESDPFSAHPFSREKAPDPFSKATSSGDGRVIAPMPGRIVRVLVAVGDRVAARQGVVIVEAMKMENELRAPRDGVVTQVLAREGTAVDTGVVLVIIE